MIFYFTGTGNSFAAARIIADANNDELINIGDSFKQGVFDFVVESGSALGFVFPTYAWTTPGIVDEFVKRLHLSQPDGSAYQPDYCFVVVSCGAFVGDTAQFFAAKLDAALGIEVDASFSIKSVGNCTYLYAPAEGEKRERLLADADESAIKIAARVAAREHVHAEDRNPFGRLLSKMTCRDEKPRSTDEFFALSSCIGCGTCVDVCPTNTIALAAGKPVWNGGTCTQCLACLHRCPTHAIQYGKSTIKRGRYLNPALLSGE